MMNKKKTRIILCVLGLGVLVFLYGSEKRVTANIRINEICTNNFSNYSDESGNYYNWVELYNPTDGQISLRGYQITDNGKNNKFVFGDISLEAGRYLTVFSQRSRFETKQECFIPVMK